jgi:hypothetical protein
MGRVIIVAILAFVPALVLYVWCRLNPRLYDGALNPRLGLLVSRGAIEILRGDT